eukprot:c43888_g1_i1 orf=122-466(+)
MDSFLQCHIRPHRSELLNTFLKQKHTRKFGFMEGRLDRVSNIDLSIKIEEEETVDEEDKTKVEVPVRDYLSGETNLQYSKGTMNHEMESEEKRNFIRDDHPEMFQTTKNEVPKR